MKKKKFKEKRPANSILLPQQAGSAGARTLSPPPLRGYVIILFIFSFLLYINTIGHDYALDDVACIQQNKFTKQGVKGIPEMLTTFYWQGYWDNNAGLYRPLSMVTFAIEYQFFPDNPHVSHFVNVLLYSLSVVLLFILLQRLCEKRSLIEKNPVVTGQFPGNNHFWIPFMTVLLFAAHPIHTEVVSNIKSRDELLSILCFLLSFLLLLDFIRDNHPLKMALALLFYFLSLLSKEGALVYLAIIPLILYFFSELANKRIIKLLIPFFIVAMVWLGIHTYVISHAPTSKITYSYLDNTLTTAPDFLSREATAISLMGKYIFLLFFPHPLSYDYSFSEVKIISFSHPKAFFSFLILTVLVVFAVLKFRKKNIISFGILFFFITMAMVANIFMLIGATFGDRLLFVPSLGFCLILALFLSRYLKTGSVNTSGFSIVKHAKFLPLLILLALYSFKTVSRNFDWKNNWTLFSKDVEASPGSSRTHYNYGTEVMNKFAFNEKDEEKKKQYLTDAIKHLEISVQIDPKAANSYLNLATAWYNMKDYGKSRDNARLAIQYDPRDVKGYSILGRSCYRMNEHEAAIKNLLRAVRENYIPDESYTFLGASYFAKGISDSAIYYMNRARELNPANKEIYLNLGSVYGSIRHFDKAIESFTKAIELDSTNKQVYYYLALTYQNMGDSLNAKKYLKKVQ